MTILPADIMRMLLWIFPVFLVFFGAIITVVVIEVSTDTIIGQWPGIILKRFFQDRSSVE